MFKRMKPVNIMPGRQVMSLYETIFTRRSVRQYDMTPLAAGVLDDITAYIGGVKQLDGQAARFEVAGGGVSGGSKAPHYVLAYCEDSTAAYINVGFTLQKVDLYLQSRGLGSWWLGMAKPDGKAEQNGCAILLAFGNTAVPLRSGENEYKRLDIHEISDTDTAVARAVRVAPSAMNSQPWMLNCKADSVVINYKGRGLMKGILKKKMSKIDVGIAAAHAELALIQGGGTVTSIVVKDSGKTFLVEILF
jgi:hypothetical protein